MIKDKKTLYKGFLEIEEIQAELKGKQVTRERLVMKDAVAGVVIDARGRIGLVSQYRPTAGAQTWELPAGVLDKPHLSIEETLIEELEEECGIAKDEILEIKKPIIGSDYYMLMGCSNSKLSMFVVYVKEQENKQIPEDNDVDEVRWFNLDEVTKLMANGEIQDSKTLIGYFVYQGIQVGMLATKSV